MTAPAESARAQQIRATVIFVDLVGFAALARESGTERAYLAVTPCLRILDEVVRKHGGSVDKYSGDKLLGVFGYPLPLEEHARAAARAALEMRRRVGEYAREMGVALALHAGINTGEIVAGDIRGPVVREFHVLGDVVNTAARLNAKAPPGEIYVGEASWEATRGRLAYRALPPFALKGKSRPVPAFALLGGDAVEEGSLGQPGSSVRLVGRERELERLREAAAELLEGKGGCVALIGAEGSGKSRLLAELARAPELSGARLLQVQCAQLERASPGRAAAEVASLLLGREFHSLDAVTQALPELLDSAARRPHVLAFEDAHLLDPEPLALLEGALAAFGERPLLVLFSFRAAADEARARLAAAAARSGTRWRELELAPLTAEAAEALLDALAPGTLDDETRALVRERAAGSPGRLVLGSFGAAALRSERELEAREEKRRERTREAERRRVAVLFADISGFTAMTESKGAARAYPVVAGALHLLEEIARKHGGTVDHFLGDCAMALFGVPEAIEDAPRAAVNAAIEMRERIESYNDEGGLEPRLAMHSGIATGQGIAGDISGPLIREYAVMGEHVDRADELTHVAERGEIYVDVETYHATAEVFEYAPGRAEPLPDGSPTSFEVRSRQTKRHRARLGVERRVFSELVGREAELEALRARLRALRGGQGGVVSIGADAGLGKSRLVEEMERSPEAEGTRWLLGRSLSTGRRLGFHPFADLLRSWSEISDRDDDAGARRRLREAIQRWMPENADEAFPFVARVLGLPLEAGDRERLDALPGDALEKLVLHHLTALLRAASSRERLVVVMDDLHWADQSSLDLLSALLPECRERPLLFVNLFRPGFSETSERIRAVAAEQVRERHTEIVLEPLAARASRDLLGNLFGAGDLPHATRQLIEEKARGNPFYIEEVVRALVDAGAVEAHAGRFRATDRIAHVAIPGSIHEVVQSRIDGLERGRRRLLQIASVIGQTFHVGVLIAVATDVENVAGNVEWLRDAEFLTPSDRLPGAEYAFRHPLVHEIAYDGLLETRREELHRRVGSAIEATLTEETPGYHGMLAYHFGKGRDLARAEAFLLRAGEDAARAAASNEALHFFEEAAGLYLKIHGDRADPAKRAALEAKVASALYHRGRFIDSVEHYDQALELLGDRLARGEREQMLGFVRDLLNVLRRLYLPIRLRRPPAGEREREIMALRYARAESTTYALPTRHVFDSMRSLALVQRFDPRSVPASAKMYAGAASLFAFGAVSFDASRRLAAMAHELAEGATPSERLYERAMNFTCRALEGDWSAEHEVDPDLVDETVRLGHLWAPVTYLGLLAEKRLYQGDFAGAEQASAQIDRIWDVYQYDLAKTNHYWLRTLTALEQGRFEDGRAAAVAYYEENPEDPLHLLALGCRAKTEILLGELDAAEKTLAEAAGIAERLKRVAPYHASRFLGSRLLLDLTRLEALPESERATPGPLRAAVRRSLKAVLSNAPRLAFSRAEMLRLAGRAEWSLGHRRRSLDLFERSVLAAEALGARAARARTFAQVGELLLLAGRREASFMGRDAIACAAEAARSIEALGIGAPTKEFMRA